MLLTRLCTQTQCHELIPLCWVKYIKFVRKFVLLTKTKTQIDIFFYDFAFFFISLLIRLACENSRLTSGGRGVWKPPDVRRLFSQATHRWVLCMPLFSFPVRRILKRWADTSARLFEFFAWKRKAISSLRYSITYKRDTCFLLSARQRPRG